MQQPVHAPLHRPDPTRRAAIALPLVQAGVALAGAGVLALAAGRPEATGFLAGAMALACGFAVFGWRTALRAPVVPANQAFVRLLVGSVLKWLVIGAGLALAMTAPGLPPGFVLGGALAAYLAYLLCLPWLLR